MDRIDSFLLLAIDFICTTAAEVVSLARYILYLRELLAVVGPKGPAADGVFEEQDFTVMDPYGVKGEGQSLYYGDIICLRNPEVRVFFQMLLHFAMSYLSYIICLCLCMNVC